MAAKVFIITGASKGIGAAVTQRLLKLSHNVVLGARSKDLLEETKSAHPGQVQYVAGDLTDPKVEIFLQIKMLVFYFLSSRLLNSYFRSQVSWLRQPSTHTAS